MFVYILASKTRHLYVGVTNDLVIRAMSRGYGAPGWRPGHRTKQQQSRKHEKQPKVFSFFRAFVLFSIDLQRIPAAALCRHDQFGKSRVERPGEDWFVDVSMDDPLRSLPLRLRLAQGKL
jgi:hypothetical protein